MVDVVLNFTQPDERLGPTSFTRDAAHARERQASALSSSTSSRSAPGPTAVRLIDGRIGHDHAEAERTAVAELLGGGGRGFVLLRQHSAVTDWHDEAQVTGKEDFLMIVEMGAGANGPCERDATSGRPLAEECATRAAKEGK